MKRIIAGVLTLFLLIGCATTPGMKNWEEAKRLQKEMDYAGTLLNMTEALVKEPDMNKAKVFLRRNFDDYMDKIQIELNSLEKQVSMETVERKYELLLSLSAVYENLSEMNLPLSEKGFLFIKGKEWTTEIVDYSRETEAARILAFDTFYKEGEKKIALLDFKESNSIFARALNLFQIQGSDEKDSRTLEIAELFCNAGDDLTAGNDLDENIAGYNAYFYAGEIKADYERAIEGIEYASKKVAAIYIDQGKALDSEHKLESYILATEKYNKALEWEADNEQAKDLLEKDIAVIVELYIERGKKLEAKGSLNELISAADEYKSAIAWNKNSDAVQLLERITFRIADYYYQEGIIAENRKDSEKAVAMYNESVKWIPGYKDALVRRNKIYLLAELENLTVSLAQTQKEFEQLNSKVSSMSSKSGSAVEAMDQLTYVADKTIEVDVNLRNTLNAAKVLKGIPVVGNVITILSRTLTAAHEPIESASKKFKKIQQPVITPVRNSINKAHGSVVKLNETMELLSSSIQKTRSMLSGINQCLAEENNADVIKEVETTSSELNRGILEINNGLSGANASLNKVEAELDKINRMVPSLNGVSSWISSIAPTLSGINSTVSSINGILDEKFTINVLVKKYTFSVRDILNGAASISDLFMDMAMKALNPLLSALNISIPSIPGLLELHNSLDYLEDTKAQIGSMTDGLNNSVSDLGSDISNIENKVDEIISLSGCSL